MAAKIDKLVVTHRAALRAKHGERGLQAIEAQLGRLIQADRRRGLTTRLVYLDVAASLQGVCAPVKRASDKRGTKQAIDALYTAYAPDYLMLLGAPDVVPHQQLENLLASKEEDRLIPSDLPYACDAPYSTTISDFLGPTRVVGRLPDVQGTGDTDYLVGLLSVATRFTSRPSRDYARYFALSTATWQVSTRKSIRRLFGSADRTQLSPGADETWTRAELSGRVHFINCHGAKRTPEFFGEDEHDQPVALRSRDLPGNVPAATIVAAECCYGAQLYKPRNAGQRGICSVYLAQGAVGFFGSTCIAWGEASRNNFADYMCIAFVKALQAGASLGSAALQARQYYVGLDGYMEMVDLKTLAQFVLLGDPSIQPMRARAAASIEAPRRRQRRVRFATKGKLIAKTTARADRPRRRQGSAALRECLARLQTRALHIESFPLQRPDEPVRAKHGRQLLRHGTVFHVVGVRKRPGSRFTGPAELLVVREVGGKVDKVVHAKRRG
jgi:hypothetical protein